MKSEILARISIILALVAAIYMSFLGASVVESSGSGVHGNITRTGAFHPILIVFVIFPVIGLRGICRHEQRTVNIAAIGMFLLTVLSFFGVGLVFLPSVIFLMNAAIFSRKEVNRFSQYQA